jgi:hypothetical protein
VAIDISGVTALNGKQGVLELATAEAVAYLGNESSKRAVLEIEVEAGGDVQTVIQTPCELLGQVIVTGALSPLVGDTPLGETTANARFVRRDVAQSPGAGELDVIWPNLGVSLDGSDVAAAISGAAAPSAANAFATMADVGNPFDQSLNTTDSSNFLTVTATDGVTSTVLDETGIVFPDASTQTTAAAAFDQALNTTDSVAFVDLDISGEITLSGFGGSTIGPISYTASDGVSSTQYSATGITFADTTVQESAPVHSAGTVVTGGGGSSITGGGYPDEITIVIGGVQYAMPARVI